MNGSWFAMEIARQRIADLHAEAARVRRLPRTTRTTRRSDLVPTLLRRLASLRQPTAVGCEA